MSDEPISSSLKYLFLFIGAIVFMAVFFMGYSQFLIPLLLAGGILLFAMKTEMGKKQPIYAVALALLAFVSVFFIQRLQIFQDLLDQAPLFLLLFS